MKESVLLFLSGFIQVFLVCMNTYFISKEVYTATFIISFLISYVWSLNVKKIAFGTIGDRFVYSSGAAVGAVVGLKVSKLVLNLC